MEQDPIKSQGQWLIIQYNGKFFFFVTLLSFFELTPLIYWVTSYRKGIVRDF